MQPLLVALLILFLRNTELHVADSSSTTSTWFSIVIRSTLNTLCDLQCRGAAAQVSRVEARGCAPYLRELDLTLEHHNSMHACVMLDYMFESMHAHTHNTRALACTHIHTNVDGPPRGLFQESKLTQKYGKLEELQRFDCDH